MKRIVALLASLALAGCGAEAHVAAQAPPSGTLYLAGMRPGEITKLDVARARVTTRLLSEVSPGDPPFMVMATDHGVVTFGHDSTYAFGSRLWEPARNLGGSTYFVPSSTPGRLWLVLPQRRGVREVDSYGNVWFRHGARAPRWAITGAVDGGMLIQPDRGLAVWDPRTGRVVRRLPGTFPAATKGSSVASCAFRCPVLHVTETRTGSDTAIRPHGFRFIEGYEGAYSPSGGLIAVPANGGRRVAIVNDDAGTASLLQGPRLAYPYSLLAWSSSGWLFYNAGNGRIAAWRPGSGRARLLPVRVPAFTDMSAD